MTDLEDSQAVEIRILQDKLRAITEANLRFKEQNVAQRKEIKLLMAEIRDLVESEDEDD